MWLFTIQKTGFKLCYLRFLVYKYSLLTWNLCILFVDMENPLIMENLLEGIISTSSLITDPQLVR